MTAVIGYIATALVVTAVYLAGRKNIWCWPIYMASNVLWIVYALADQQAPIILLQVILFTLNAVGWRAWLRGGDGNV